MNTSTSSATVPSLEQAIDDEMAAALEAMHSGVDSSPPPAQPSTPPIKPTPPGKKSSPTKAKKEEEAKKGKPTLSLRNASKRLKSPESHGTFMILI